MSLVRHRGRPSVLLRLELEHLGRCRRVVVPLRSMCGILAEVADLTLALHATQRLPQETALLLPKPLDPTELLLATIPAGTVAEGRSLPLAIRNVTIVVALQDRRKVTC